MTVYQCQYIRGLPPVITNNYQLFNVLLTVSCGCVCYDWQITPWRRAQRSVLWLLVRVRRKASLGETLFRGTSRFTRVSQIMTWLIVVGNDDVLCAQLIKGCYGKLLRAQR